jgi:hypothetical protein
LHIGRQAADKRLPAQIKEGDEECQEKKGEDGEEHVEDGKAVDAADLAPLQKDHERVEEIGEHKGEEKA